MARYFYVVMVLSLLVACDRRSEEHNKGDAKKGEVAQEQEDAMTAIKKARTFYAERPYYERPRDYSEVPEGLGDTDAETCGACHKAIYEEWKISTHHRAYKDDAQFMEELKKSSGLTKHSSGDVGWVCVNCHTPTYPQLERLVVDLEDDTLNKPVYVDNPLFDPAQQEDAITCATCHVKDGKILGPYGSDRAPHPVKKEESLLDERVCASCHQASAQYPEHNLGCFFSTAEEWRQSSYGQKGESCQSCHMPEVVRKVAEDFDVPERKTRRHWFGGSLIPKKPEFAAELEPLQKVYGSGITFDLSLRGKEAKFTASAEPINMPEKHIPEVVSCTKDCMVLKLDIRNNRAGHHMPTGDPERHIDILVEVHDANQKLVARAYHVLGSRYAWWPKIKLLQDTRIPSGEQRELLVSAPLPGAEVKYPLRVHVTADKWRMYLDAFEHHQLDGKYVRGRRFYDAQWLLGEDSALNVVKIEDDGVKD